MYNEIRYIKQQMKAHAAKAHTRPIERVNIKAYEDAGYKGPDEDLETSLLEYGFVYWTDEDDPKKKTEFVVSVDTPWAGGSEAEEAICYTYELDREDFRDILGRADAAAVTEGMEGVTEEDLIAGFPHTVQDLVSYYGACEIFHRPTYIGCYFIVMTEIGAQRDDHEDGIAAANEIVEHYGRTK